MSVAGAKLALVSTAIPEPSSFALIGTGIVGLLGFGRRRVR
jgi:PEP-CTERM motif